MKPKLFVSTIIILLLITTSYNASALTMKQVSEICNSVNGKCSDNQTMRAYVGGALDLIATLDERTDYLKKVYCKNPKALFDVPKIINYMQQHSQQYANDNAMLVFVRFFEEHGGCKK